MKNRKNNTKGSDPIGLLLNATMRLITTLFIVIKKIVTFGSIRRIRKVNTDVRQFTKKIQEEGRKVKAVETPNKKERLKNALIKMPKAHRYFQFAIILLVLNQTVVCDEPKEYENGTVFIADETSKYHTCYIRLNEYTVCHRCNSSIKKETGKPGVLQPFIRCDDKDAFVYRPEQPSCLVRFDILSEKISYNISCDYTQKKLFTLYPADETYVLHPSTDNKWLCVCNYKIRIAKFRQVETANKTLDGNHVFGLGQHQEPSSYFSFSFPKKWNQITRYVPGVLIIIYGYKMRNVPALVLGTIAMTTIHTSAQPTFDDIVNQTKTVFNNTERMITTNGLDKIGSVAMLLLLLFIFIKKMPVFATIVIAVVIAYNIQYTKADIAEQCHKYQTHVVGSGEKYFLWADLHEECQILTSKKTAPLSITTTGAIVKGIEMVNQYPTRLLWDIVSDWRCPGMGPAKCGSEDHRSLVYARSIPLGWSTGCFTIGSGTTCLRLTPREKRGVVDAGVVSEYQIPRGRMSVNMILETQGKKETIKLIEGRNEIKISLREWTLEGTCYVRDVNTVNQYYAVYYINGMWHGKVYRQPLKDILDIPWRKNRDDAWKNLESVVQIVGLSDFAIQFSTRDFDLNAIGKFDNIFGRMTMQEGKMNIDNIRPDLDIHCSLITNQHVLPGPPPCKVSITRSEHINKTDNSHHLFYQQTGSNCTISFHGIQCLPNQTYMYVQKENTTIQFMNFKCDYTAEACVNQKCIDIGPHDTWTQFTRKVYTTWSKAQSSIIRLSNWGGGFGDKMEGFSHWLKTWLGFWKRLEFAVASIVSIIIGFNTQGTTRKIFILFGFMLMIPSVYAQPQNKFQREKEMESNVFKMAIEKKSSVVMETLHKAKSNYPTKEEKDDVHQIIAEAENYAQKKLPQYAEKIFNFYTHGLIGFHDFIGIAKYIASNLVGPQDTFLDSVIEKVNTEARDQGSYTEEHKIKCIGEIFSQAVSKKTTAANLLRIVEANIMNNMIRSLQEGNEMWRDLIPIYEPNDDCYQHFVMMTERINAIWERLVKEKRYMYTDQLKEKYISAIERALEDDLKESGYAIAFSKEHGVTVGKFKDIEWEYSYSLYGGNNPYSRGWEQTYFSNCGDGYNGTTVESHHVDLNKRTMRSLENQTDFVIHKKLDQQTWFQSITNYMQIYGKGKHLVFGICKGSQSDCSNHTTHHIRRGNKLVWIDEHGEEAGNVIYTLLTHWKGNTHRRYHLIHCGAQMNQLADNIKYQHRSPTFHHARVTSHVDDDESCPKFMMKYRTYIPPEPDIVPYTAVGWCEGYEATINRTNVDRWFYHVKVTKGGSCHGHKSHFTLSWLPGRSCEGNMEHQTHGHILARSLGGQHNFGNCEPESQRFNEFRTKFDKILTEGNEGKEMYVARNGTNFFVWTTEKVRVYFMEGTETIQGPSCSRSSFLTNTGWEDV
nr:TPA_asm: hypothetical protein [Fluviflavili virus]